MLTAAPEFEVDAFFANLRSQQYGRLDRANEAYLDFTGSALYAECQVERHAERLKQGVFGNPHSENGPSRSSTRLIEHARSRVLEFLDASPDVYTVCFTANTSAAIKLVAESYAFGPRVPLVLAADNHNSMNGVREYARRRGAAVHVLPLDGELLLDDPVHAMKGALNGNRGSSAPLLGLPAQSNFSGVKHPLDLVETAQSMGFAVLLDAAAFLPASPLSLSDVPADFVAFSAYKMLGHPTGVGALVARRDSLSRLERPWFAGGTVEYASVQNGTHLLRSGAEGFEDGTPAFLDIAAVADGLDYLDSVGTLRIQQHVRELTGHLVESLESLSHYSGSPVVRLYGPRSLDVRGGTVAFNVLDPRGMPVPFDDVVDRARDEGVSLRGGCFCNPGASEAAVGFRKDATAECLRSVASDGFSVRKLSECLGPGIAVGAVRASVGIATNTRDIDRAVGVAASFGSASGLLTRS
jgi:selenocysteine lyase/cysteine desulfurase